MGHQDEIFHLLLFFVLYYQYECYPQNSFSNKHHPLSGTFGISLEGGATYTFSDFNKDGINIFGRASLEYIFPASKFGAIGLRGYGGAGYLTGSDNATGSRPELEEFKTQFWILGGGAEYFFILSEFFVPYIYGGAALLYFDPRDNSGTRLTRNSLKIYSRTQFTLNGEFGMRFLVSENISLNLGVNINNVQTDNLDDVVAGSDNDFFLTGFGGITFYFGGAKDSDLDGINDNEDACPKTPFGVAVDQFGCAVDSDKDGVPDYLDRCSQYSA